jgi:hypothetical protein
MDNVIKDWKLLDLARGANSLVLSKQLVPLEHALALVHIPSLYHKI